MTTTEPHSLRTTLQYAWAPIATAYPSYALLLPGDPSFICQPATCDAWCCRSLTVPLDDGELAHLARTSGRALIDLVEIEDGAPLRLPLAQPYVLARADNHCAHLGDDLACTVYEGRPGACKLYPHQVLVIDPTSSRPAPITPQHARSAVDAVVEGATPNPLPLLLRHTACPGFTGPALDDTAWAALFRETVALQFPLEGS